MGLLLFFTLATPTIIKRTIFATNGTEFILKIKCIPIGPASHVYLITVFVSSRNAMSATDFKISNAPAMSASVNTTINTLTTACATANQIVRL